MERKGNRRLGWLLSAVAVVLLAAGALAMLGSVAGAGNEWGCDGDRIGTEVFEFGESGGSKDPTAAREALIVYLKDQGVADDSYLAALRSESGPDRFEPDTGRLWIDDQVRVEMFAAQLDDGTWAVGMARYCMPLPEQQSPGLTPSAEPSDGATSG
ncbi:MAG: hypothetical protein U0V56_08650 [Actinomycetota bacterium]